MCVWHLSVFTLSPRLDVQCSLLLPCCLSSVGAGRRWRAQAASDGCGAMPATPWFRASKSRSGGASPSSVGAYGACPLAPPPVPQAPKSARAQPQPRRMHIAGAIAGGRCYHTSSRCEAQIKRVDARQLRGEQLATYAVRVVDGDSALDGLSFEGHKPRALLRHLERSLVLAEYPALHSHRTKDQVRAVVCAPPRGKKFRDLANFLRDRSVPWGELKGAEAARIFNYPARQKPRSNPPVSAAMKRARSLAATGVEPVACRQLPLRPEFVAFLRGEQSVPTPTAPAAHDADTDTSAALHDAVQRLVTGKGSQGRRLKPTLFHRIVEESGRQSGDEAALGWVFGRLCLRPALAELGRSWDTAMEKLTKAGRSRCVCVSIRSWPA